MRNKKLIVIAILGLVVALGMPMMASAQTLERIQSSGAVNIGYVPDQGPLSFESADGQPVGYAVELAQKVADALKAQLGMPNLTVNMTPTDLAGGLDMVADNRLDLLCGSISDTLERRERVSFSIPVYITGTAALVRTDAPPDLVRVLRGEKAHTGPIWRGSINRALSNQTYAVHEGTVTEQWVRDQVNMLGVIATVVTVPEHAQGVQMVVDREAGAYFADRVILDNYATLSPDSDQLMVLDRYFTYTPIAMAVARNDDDFRLLVDRTLSDLYRSGGIVEIYQRYFGEPSEMALHLFDLFGLR